MFTFNHADTPGHLPPATPLSTPDGVFLPLLAIPLLLMLAFCLMVARKRFGTRRSAPVLNSSATLCGGAPRGFTGRHHQSGTNSLPPLRCGQDTVHEESNDEVNQPVSESGAFTDGQPRSRVLYERPECTVERAPNRFDFLSPRGWTVRSGEARRDPAYDYFLRRYGDAAASQQQFTSIDLPPPYSLLFNDKKENSSQPAVTGASSQSSTLGDCPAGVGAMTTELSSLAVSKPPAYCDVWITNLIIKLHFRDVSLHLKVVFGIFQKCVLHVVTAAMFRCPSSKEIQIFYACIQHYQIHVYT